MQSFSEITDKVDNLTIRERVAVFVAVLAVVFFVWDSYLMTDLANREKLVKTSLQQKQAERVMLNVELGKLVTASREDPNAMNQKKLEMLRVQLEKVRTEVNKSTEHLVAPDKMAAILESVLYKTRGLDLVEVKGLGSSALIQKEKSNNETAKEDGNAQATDREPSLSNAYRHGLKIVFNGSYMSTLQYIRELENLNSGFLWEGLEFEVKEYPEATATITVFTLSLDSVWIGV